MSLRSRCASRPTWPTAAWPPCCTSRSRSEKPLLLEGEAGVGKTELAKALAAVTGARLIRLQCYEGIDVAHALYDWNYARQLLYIRTLEAGQAAPAGDAARAVRARVPGAAAAAGRDRERRPRAAGAADRRDRPRRRRVRGLPARAAVRLPGHDPRDRHHHRPAPAARDPHVQPHPRAARRAQAPLPLPLDRPPGAGARDRDRARPRARACRSGWPPRPPPSCSGCASSTSPSRPASPRRSTGRRRCWRSASRSWRPAWSTPRWARC